MFSRPFAAAGEGRPSFEVGTTTDMALAAWNGDADDRTTRREGGLAVRAALDLRCAAAPFAAERPREGVLMAGGTVGGLLIVVLLFIQVTDPVGRRS